MLYTLPLEVVREVICHLDPLEVVAFVDAFSPHDPVNKLGSLLQILTDDVDDVAHSAFPSNSRLSRIAIEDYDSFKHNALLNFIEIMDAFALTESEEMCQQLGNAIKRTHNFILMTETPPCEEHIGPYGVHQLTPSSFISNTIKSSSITFKRLDTVTIDFDEINGWGRVKLVDVSSVFIQYSDPLDDRSIAYTNIKALQLHSTSQKNIDLYDFAQDPQERLNVRVNPQDGYPFNFSGKSIKAKKGLELSLDPIFQDCSIESRSLSLNFTREAEVDLNSMLFNVHAPNLEGLALSNQYLAPEVTPVRIADGIPHSCRQNQHSEIWRQLRILRIAFSDLLSFPLASPGMFDNLEKLSITIQWNSKLPSGEMQFPNLKSYALVLYPPVPKIPKILAPLVTNLSVDVFAKLRGKHMKYFVQEFFEPFPMVEELRVHLNAWSPDLSPIILKLAQKLTKLRIWQTDMKFLTAEHTFPELLTLDISGTVGEAQDFILNTHLPKLKEIQNMVPIGVKNVTIQNLPSVERIRMDHGEFEDIHIRNTPSLNHLSIYCPKWKRIDGDFLEWMDVELYGTDYTARARKEDK